MNRTARIREVLLLTVTSTADRPSKHLRALSIKGPKEIWLNHLDQFAPPGVSTRGVDNINDAYRHYMSAAELTQLIGGDLTYNLGDLNEKLSSINAPESTKMDYANNDAGIAAGQSSASAVESALAFVRDVVSGKVKVVDKDSGKVRDASVRDLPEHYDGDALEDKYRPDRGGSEGLGGDEGETMVA
jgi:uncharacterized protein DUF6973